jgi:hypothetical protein
LKMSTQIGEEMVLPMPISDNKDRLLLAEKIYLRIYYTIK